MQSTGKEAHRIGPIQKRIEISTIASSIGTACGTEAHQMEDDTEKAVAIGNGGSEDGGGSRSHWWWALGGATQLGWGITSVVRGYGGDSRFMILKAFSIASLFVGGAASTSMAALHASGIRKVEDLIEVGANIRTGLGVPERTHTAKLSKETDDL